MKKGVATWCMVAVVIVLVAEVHEAAAVCNPLELSPCLGAIQGGGDPTPECCSKLKEQEQEQCFCDYLKNPMIAPYINSPNAKNIEKICGVKPPKCS